jgi:hypothetical protein
MMAVVVAIMMVMMIHLPFALISPSQICNTCYYSRSISCFLYPKKGWKLSQAIPAKLIKGTEWLVWWVPFEGLNALKCYVLNCFSALEFIILYFSILFQLVLEFMSPFCHLVAHAEDLTTWCFKKMCTMLRNASISMEEGNIYHDNDLS